jgi:hypothetical protein
MANWGSVDFSDFKRLRENLARLDTRRQQFCEDCARELAARLLALVIPRTPVGKKPTLVSLGGEKKTYRVKGRNGKIRSFLTREGAILDKYWSGYMGGTLRRGWTAKTEQEAQGRTGRGSVADGTAYARQLPVARTGDGYQITVTNPVSYASYVEFGHRQKPGRYIPQIGKQLKNGWVKGQFMLSISEHQLEGIAPGVLEKKLAAYLSEVFDG